MPKNTTFPWRRSIRRLRVTRKPISELGQIVDLAQVDGEARVFMRLDQLVKPVALAELPVGGVFVRCFESDDQHTAHVLGCEFEHASSFSPGRSTDDNDRSVVPAPPPTRGQFRSRPIIVIHHSEF